MSGIEASDFENYGVDQIVWEHSLEFETKRMRIHFTNIETPNPRLFEIAVINIDDKVLLRIPGERFSARTDYWTKNIYGNYLAVQVRSKDNQLPNGLKFRIENVVIDEKGIEVQNITYPADFRDAADALLENRIDVWRRAQSVALLTFNRGDEEKQCTGFMISENELMTNAHCVDTDEICRTAVARFGYQFTENFKRSDGEEFKCLKVSKALPKLDFAILELEGEPGGSGNWGHLILSDRMPKDREQLYIVQHPAYKLKKVVWNDCYVKTASAFGNNTELKTDFGHLCDTQNGSSGAPILSSDHKVVGLHHLGFEQFGDNWRDENRGVWMNFIIPELSKE